MRRFNGARFFWNREVRTVTSLDQGGTCFNGARFFWNREGHDPNGHNRLTEFMASMGPGSFGTGKFPLPLLAKAPSVQLQWGPVLLEPGRGDRRRERASIAPSFNGARFFWNREGAEALADTALSGLILLQWGPVLLEPGSAGPRRS